MSDERIPSQVLALVYRVIDEVNAQQPPDRKLVKGPDTVLSGKRGLLDSLGLITLLVGVEDGVADAFGKSVKLVDEKLMTDTEGPLGTIGGLAAYVATQLDS